MYICTLYFNILYIYILHIFIYKFIYSASDSNMKAINCLILKYYLAV